MPCGESEFRSRCLVVANDALYQAELNPLINLIQTFGLAWQDSNLRMRGSKPRALPTWRHPSNTALFYAIELKITAL